MVPAFGCTEPIALAFASARAKSILGSEPKKIIAKLSGNIVKNANSVKVPGTNGRKGIEISILAGAFLGDHNKKLEVLSGIDKSKLTKMDELIKENVVDVKLIHDKIGLYIDIYMEDEKNSSRVIISDYHTNIIFEQFNNDILLDEINEFNEKVDDIKLDFKSIYEFAKSCDYSCVKDVLDMEIEYNYAIAKEGLENDWGANVGKLVLNQANGNNYEKYVAYAAAGSDARMSGCELPVVINSGSGNQGITVSVPVITYCLDNGIDKNLLYRGLLFANLIALYIKEGIGELSAYCGVVSAAAAAVSGIAFVNNENDRVIKDVIINSLATNSGIICDGAKESCAMKIASSLKIAMLSYSQSKSGNTFKDGDGIVSSDVDKMITTVGHIAKKGMKETDKIILKEMIRESH